MFPDRAVSRLFSRPLVAIFRPSNLPGTGSSSGPGYSAYVHCPNRELNTFISSLTAAVISDTLHSDTLRRGVHRRRLRSPFSTGALPARSSGLFRRCQYRLTTPLTRSVSREYRRAVGHRTPLHTPTAAPSRLADTVSAVRYPPSPPTEPRYGSRKNRKFRTEDILDT